MKKLLKNDFNLTTKMASHFDFNLKARIRKMKYLYGKIIYTGKNMFLLIVFVRYKKVLLKAAKYCFPFNS